MLANVIAVVRVAGAQNRCNREFLIGAKMLVRRSQTLWNPKLCQKTDRKLIGFAGDMEGDTGHIEAATWRTDQTQCLPNGLDGVIDWDGRSGQTRQLRQHPHRGIDMV